MEKTESLMNRWYGLKNSIPSLQDEINALDNRLSNIRNGHGKDNTADGIDRLIKINSDFETKKQQLEKDKEAFKQAESELLKRMELANVSAIKVPAQANKAGFEIFRNADGGLNSISAM
jgi:hypothetical protein